MKEPSGFDSTLTPGMVSRIYSASNTALSETQVINARTVQHNAPINPGNSGGPLFDDCGTVIGVNSFSPKGAQGLFFSIHSGEVIRFLRELNIGYSSIGHACMGSSLSSGSGLLLPLIIGMAAALAVVAVVFAWRGGAAVGAVGQYVSRRLTGIRGQPSPPAGARCAACAGGGKQLGADRGRPLPATARGREGLRARGGTHGRRRSRAAVRDRHRGRRHGILGPRPPGDRCPGPARHHHRSEFFQRHVPQRRPASTATQAEVGDVLRFGNAEFKLAAGAVAAAVGGGTRRRPRSQRLDAVGLRPLGPRVAVRAAAAGAQRPCGRAGHLDRRPRPQPRPVRDRRRQRLGRARADHLRRTPGPEPARPRLHQRHPPRRHRARLPRRRR